MMVDMTLRRIDRMYAKRRMVTVDGSLGACWEWAGYRNPDGYGHTQHLGKRWYVHRLAYWVLVGPIPEGRQLDHLCRNPPCFNPDHLEPVTSRENTMRGENWSARKAAQTHCIRGHEFTDTNTLVRRNGTRCCRTCAAARLRWQRLRRRGRDVSEVRIAAPVASSRPMSNNDSATTTDEETK